ncbi:MAG: gliding motility-associated transporter substrate-binding protein GldG [Bacteroidota bacterium]|jgi:ABC-2 type transport system permease protein
MAVLIQREFTALVCSGIGLLFSFIFLLVNGLMLWVFEGNFNILDRGYASGEMFFSLSSLLFLVLIPALTMRSFAEEKLKSSLILLRTRPVSIFAIWISKWLACLLLISLLLLSTVIYIYTLYALANPAGNIDFGVVALSYIGLCTLAAVFTALDILASSVTKNQIIAFVLGLCLNLFVYYGFDLISSVFRSGSLQNTITSFGLLVHFSQMLRGVLIIADVSIFIVYISVACILSIYVLELKNKSSNKYVLTTLGGIVLVCLTTTLLPTQRFDFTADKRYTISNYSTNLMRQLATDKIISIQIVVYLDGNLNAGFQRLQKATMDMLTDLNRYANQQMKISLINPSELSVSREKLPEQMAQQGMKGILLNEVDRDGKLSQQLIYPYAQAILGKDTLTIPLLKNVLGNTAEENLNISAQNLEFAFIDAFRLLLNDEEQNIAFIEGHGELSRAYVYDAEETLAKYFFVNRGMINNDVTVLDDFKALIIAGSNQLFTETEKYVLDQYMMKGGKILWLIDGVSLSQDDLATKGQSASMKNETGLDNLLFTYGVRIEPNLIQDSQCSQILVNTRSQSQSVAIPWYYSPILLSSSDHLITKDVGELKSEFVSSVHILNNTKQLKKSILLTTSRYSHLVQVPEMIDFDIEKIQINPSYFETSFVPVAVSLEGQFTSAYENRPISDSIYMANHVHQNKSVNTKMIVVSSSTIIANDIAGQGTDTDIIPMGYDRLSKRQYGNKEFIVNAINWLVNDDELMLLRSKSRQLDVLNKQAISENRYQYALFNVGIPILIIFILIGFVNIRRWQRYAK